MSIEMFDYVNQLTQYYRQNGEARFNWTPNRLATPNQVANQLTQTKFFDCTQIEDYAWEAMKDMFPDKDTPPNEDCILPAPSIAFFINGTEADGSQEPLLFTLQLEGKKHDVFDSDENIKDISWHNFSVMIHTANEKEVNKLAGTKNFVCPQVCGVIHSEETEDGIIKNFEMPVPNKQFDVYGKQENQDWQMTKIIYTQYMCTLLSIINQPRFVETQPASINRAARRRSKLAMGMATDAWHRVSWNIDKPVKARTPHDKNYHKLPLHFRRGHWKNAKEHHPKSVLRNGKWKTWINGYWAGHPAFGFKKQYWRPTKKVA